MRLLVVPAPGGEPDPGLVPVVGDVPGRDQEPVRRGWGTPPPDGRLSQIFGIDEKGARVIEVWRSADDAQAFAEKSRPFLEAAKLPAPSRVVGFDVTSYIVS